MSKITARTDTVMGACGIGVLNEFEVIGSSRGYYGPTEPIETLPNDGGCGWLVCGYVNDKECRAAYEVLKGTHKVIFQSPVRRNTNSNNDFFFVLYDTLDSKAIADADASWEDLL